MPDPVHIVVAAAVICRADSFLLARRLEGTHLAGLWEFPGGKCEAGESLERCLARELEEELGVASRVLGRRLTTRHVYGPKHIELHFFDCQIEGEPHPRLGQELRWVPRDELRVLPLPEADRDLIDLLTG
jgi:mutator protein MutT